jgi:hypothetical protein
VLEAIAQLCNERVQVRLSSISGYRSGDSFLWTCRADFPQYTLSLSLTHTHTHARTHARTHRVGASQRGRLAASHRVSIEKGEWISEEIVYCKKKSVYCKRWRTKQGGPTGKKKRTGGNNQLHKERIVCENSLNYRTSRKTKDDAGGSRKGKEGEEEENNQVTTCTLLNPDHSLDSFVCCRKICIT